MFLFSSFSSSNVLRFHVDINAWANLLKRFSGTLALTQ
jgi:hypothetical protein